MAKDIPFDLHSEFEAAGDQPAAIVALAEGLRAGDKHQTLLGVTGSGKTFTLANVIAEVRRPALVISHNKTLAAQLYSELRGFFPNNAIEYFVSYYDYYQPEAYIPQTDTYIAKDASINEELEKLRLSATSSLIERRDVIVVSSVSCLFGLGSPEDFEAMRASIRVDGELERDDLLRRLIDIQYERNDIAPSRGSFRASGDTVDIYPSYRDDFVRIEFWADTVDRITRRDPLTSRVVEDMDEAVIFPAKHFVMPHDRVRQAEKDIMAELDDEVRKFEEAGRLIEAQRLYQRTMYDLEMLREIGYCSGIENYSRHLAKRPPGSRPYTLIDYFPDDFVTIVDESHVTIPQVRAMFRADRNRKLVLVDNGFRLPSALDNRPLSFEEFSELQKQIVFVSATPADYELEITTPVEQVVRPTGLLDPDVEVRPLETQIDDVIHEIRDRASRSERVLVTTLTKRTAEDLSDYLRELDLRVRYLHSDLDAIERVDIIRNLRAGAFDCLVGINLLREGLDLPEVSLVAILDADKEGFLRSEKSLIQTAGRAARNVDGKVILYADKVTDSMRRMIAVTDDRRQKQSAYNEEHGITPRTVQRAIQSSLHLYEEAEEVAGSVIREAGGDYDVTETIRQLEADMQEAAELLEFERAAMIRDQIYALKRTEETTAEADASGDVPPF
ncbi:MAG: excinuclease ABC subunit UvrB [Lentisphaerae bacterium]|jgi:excinuclease ABC subunit B|nr:excinuclease ABC subunit UvrB [Lentisphaerota bacterium]MBT4819193.1 excinuclease ABC subunit UvrB [Lentisphaerota bacterium]MBT5606602.1 excinuclease ABC subunit UvrB [Lentisphaerota bacterium]MBT7059555.1 excinuclease ABC subunit UvrB [Lentisphaerota bacterium]MBT7843008.1 excinuclease ABC subunit UvrB [Lentisphaerota bacterium]